MSGDSQRSAETMMTKGKGIAVAWTATVGFSFLISLLHVWLLRGGTADWIAHATTLPLLMGVLFWFASLPILLGVASIATLAIRRLSSKMTLLACCIFAIYWQVLVSLGCMVPLD